MKTYMVKRAFWKISKKKKEIATFPGGGKKKGFEIAEICGGFGQDPSFLLLKSPYIYIYT
jgi:hypothetical protein